MPLKDRQEPRALPRRRRRHQAIILALRNIEKDWKIALRTCKLVTNQLAIMFGERFTNAIIDYEIWTAHTEFLTGPCVVRTERSLCLTNTLPISSDINSCQTPAGEWEVRTVRKFLANKHRRLHANRERCR